MDFLVRFAQMHESFRKAELQALAELEGVNMEIKDYKEDVSAFVPSILNAGCSTLAKFAFGNDFFICFVRHELYPWKA